MKAYIFIVEYLTGKEEKFYSCAVDFNAAEDKLNKHLKEKGAASIVFSKFAASMPTNLSKITILK